MVAQVLEQNPNNHFVAIANAQAQANNTLYAPAIFHRAFGRFTTGTNIINPNNTPVNVSVTYYASDGTVYPTTPFSLETKAVASIYQGGDSGNGLPAGGLVDNFAGSAIISTSGGGVVLVVNESGGITPSGAALSGTYGAAASGSGRVGLPVMANNGFGYVTGATIMNTSGQPVSGNVQYYNTDGSLQGGPQPFNIGAHASQLVYQGDSSLPNPFYGEAIVTQVGGPNNSLIVTTNALSASFFYTYTEPNQ